MVLVQVVSLGPGLVLLGADSSGAYIWLVLKMRKHPRYRQPARGQYEAQNADDLKDGHGVAIYPPSGEVNPKIRVARYAGRGPTRTRPPAISVRGWDRSANLSERLTSVPEALWWQCRTHLQSVLPSSKRSGGCAVADESRSRDSLKANTTKTPYH
jgi:hypothetical protein